MDFLSWFAFLGVGGTTGLLLVLWLAPHLLPAVAVGILRAVFGTAGAALSYFMTEIVLPGATHLFANRAAVTLFVCGVLVAGWAGDRYEFVRPYIPAWMQSEPGQVKAVRAQEQAKRKATPKRATTPRVVPRSTFDEIRCSLTSECS